MREYLLVAIVERRLARGQEILQVLILPCLSKYPSCRPSVTSGPKKNRLNF